MGIGDSGMLAVGESVAETTVETIRAHGGPGAELISIYYGADVTEDEAETLAEQVRAQFPDCEVELNDGGQPISLLSAVCGIKRNRTNGNAPQGGPGIRAGTRRFLKGWEYEYR